MRCSKLSPAVRTRTHQRGFSFVEVIVTSAVLVLFFSGLFSGVQFMVTLIGDSKAKAGAVAMMEDRMEYIRSLSYDAVGTVSGVPSGTIPQTRTITLNGIVYHERVLIIYVDDPADGVGAADTNGILTDYKQIKIEETWSIHNKNYTTAIVSSVVPQSIETSVGGGTIKVNVFNAATQPVAGASVHFVNTTTTSTIDTLRYTDGTGVAYLSGAPAAANYQITVTSPGYSTDGTYNASSTNPNPTTKPIAVVQSQVSTMNFQIDVLSNLLVSTVGPATYGTFTDTFASSTLLASTTNTQVVGGDVLLAGSVGAYAPSGLSLSTSTHPSTIASWYSASFSASTTASTSVHIAVLYNNGGVWQLVPDSDLPGNSTGFSTSPINLTTLNPSTYSALALQGTLTSSNVNQTPALHQWSLTYITNQPGISGVPLSLAGAKSIGTSSSSQPVLKYTSTGTSNSSGQWVQNNLEWDLYTLSVLSSGYSVEEMCPTSPLSLLPGVSKTMTVTLGAPSSHSLRVSVVDSGGNPVPNAAVHLTNTGVNVAGMTSLCGQVYFGTGLFDDANYTLTVSASGHSTYTSASTTISGVSTANVTLN